MTDRQEQQPGYRSYLLRLWRVPGDGGPLWRASLEEPQTQQIQHFKDLSSLLSFLQTQTGQAGEDDSSDWTFSPTPRGGCRRE